MMCKVNAIYAIIMYHCRIKICKKVYEQQENIVELRIENPMRLRKYLKSRVDKSNEKKVKRNIKKKDRSRCTCETNL